MGDYIERAAALNVNFKIPTRFCESKLTTARKAVQEYANEIEKIPAADVRPVVRGEWIGNTRHKSCSECHMAYCVPDGQDGELDMTAYHYCPNCGADMRIFSTNCKKAVTTGENTSGLT